MRDLNDTYIQKMIANTRTQYADFLKYIDSASMQKASEETERYRQEIEKTVSSALSQYQK